MATARDRDRIRQIILENLGWTILRVWSTDFFIDPEAALDRLHAGIDGILEIERTTAEARRSAEEEGTSDDAPGVPWEAGADDGEFSAQNERPAADDLSDRLSRAEAAPAEPDRWIEAQAIREAPEEAPQLIASAPAGSHIAEGSPPPPSVPWPSAPAGSAPDPQRFYDDPSYRGELAAMATAIIDEEGPVTFQALCVRIARAHGFQRTGREIVATVRAALGRQRSITGTSDGGEVCWPQGVAPTPTVAFRDMKGRDWKDVPYPEKLGLVAALRSRHDDLPRAVASRIGLARARAPFIAEIEALAREAAVLPD
jgi:hypothetical protein